MYGTREEFVYAECLKCGSMQLVNIPKMMSVYYPDYYSMEHASFGRTKRLLAAFIKKRNLYAVGKGGYVGKLLYEWFPHSKLHSLSYIDIMSNSKILDVGCGSGLFLKELETCGFSSLYGIDPFNSEQFVSKSLRIESKFFFEVTGEFDLICFNHSFEHMTELPIDILEKANDLLTRHGYCLISIPIASSYAWERFKSNWVQIDAPRHLFVPSALGMDLVSRKAGFIIDRIIYNSNEFQFWGSIQYEHNIPLRDNRSYGTNRNRSIFDRKAIALFRRYAQTLNFSEKGDCATFYLRKKLL